jgi:acetyl-CoA carboxylase biotin carboxyl carrier protein
VSQVDRDNAGARPESATTHESGITEQSGAEVSVAGLVGLLTERALAMAVQAPRAPSSVRISAGEVRVEICWPTEAAAVTGPTGSTGQHGVTQDGGPRPAGVAGHGGEVETPQFVRETNGNGAHGKADPAAAGTGADGFQLCAGTVGTFYRAPEPGAAPFVAEGDTVRPGQQVAIIEAMKLMIPVEAERAGVVIEFLVADRAPVEYGQPLMLLREAGQ